MSDEPGQEDRLIERLIDEAVKNVFDLHELNPKQFRSVVEYFEGGKTLDLGDNLSAAEVLHRVDSIRGFRSTVQSIASSFESELAKGPHADGFHASIAEFLLEALHSHNRLNRTRRTRSSTYGS
jgi:magnesium chelatase subunit I